MGIYKNIFAICLLFVLFSLFSCKKKHKLSTIYLQPGILEWCDYKPCSYWVYNDIITNSIDSYYLFKREENISEDIEHYGGNYQYILYYTNSTNTTNISSIILPFDSYRSYYDAWQFGVKFNFSVNSICDNNPNNSYNNTFCNGISDSLKINNIYYYNIICYKFFYGQSIFYSYWAKHIGVVRKVEIKNSDSTVVHVWDLQRYNIIQ